MSIRRITIAEEIYCTGNFAPRHTYTCPKSDYPIVDIPVIFVRVRAVPGEVIPGELVQGEVNPEEAIQQYIVPVHAVS